MEIYDFLKEHGIEYHNKKLIDQAFTHSSYVNEHRGGLHDNERLEFMGDAVLQIYSAKKLFEINPPLKEGQMTTRRANLVCEKMLAKIVREFKLNAYLKLGVGEEKTGGRDRDSIIADMFEAFIGAIYIDTDINNVFKLLDIVMAHHIYDSQEIDYKTKLQEFIQADSRRTLDYEVVSSEGPSNNPEFTVVVKVDGLVYGKGKGSSKKEAQKNAAKDALERMAL